MKGVVYFICLLLFCSNSYSQQISTGYDRIAKAMYSSGQTDGYWNVLDITAAPNGTPQPATVASNQWEDCNLSNAQWISTSTGALESNHDFAFSTSFNLVNPGSTYSLHLEIRGDNSILSIILNGQTLTPPAGGWKSWSNCSGALNTIDIPTGNNLLVQNNNTLKVIVRNADNWMGLNVYGIIAVPDPCSQVVLNQSRVVELNTPNYSVVSPGGSLSWKINSVPALVAPVTQYKLIKQIAPERVDAQGVITPDWANASQIIVNNASIAIGTYSDNVSSFSPAITASNINKNYYWRVGIQHKPVDAQAHQPVTWSPVYKLTVQPAAVMIAQESYLTNNSQHTNNINWVYGVSYLDDGQTSEGIAYIDGLGKSRQVQSKINSDNRIMAVEAAYSEEGGGSVMSLPAPLASGANFGYAHRFFDVTTPSGPKDFRTEDFDREIKGSINTLMPPTAVDNASGSVGAYYSTANTDANIDDAKGYPYAYNVGYKSPLQRPMLSAGGVGETFKMTAGKEYKHFYGKPAQKELDRVYGVTDAPESEKVSRTITYDPNGVGYVTYKDNEGKVIATALTVCDGGAPSLNPLTEDGMTPLNVTINPLENDAIDKTTLVKQAGSKFFIPCTTNVTLNYQADLNSFTVNGIGCRTCKFDVTVSIVNETTGENVFNYQQSLIPSASVCSTGTAEHVTIINQSVSLPGPANYLINRTVKPYKDPITGNDLITQTVNEYLNYVAVNQNGSLLTQFTNEYGEETSWYVLRKTLTAINQPISQPVTLPYTEETFSGSGVACNADGLILNAEYYSPRGVTFASAATGDYYVADTYNHTIRRITKSGQVTTFVGKACTTGTADGIAAAARFNYPYDLVYRPQIIKDVTNPPALYVADKNNNAIRQVTLSDASVFTLAPFNGSGMLPTLINLPEGVGIDNLGKIYVASTGNNKIVKMNFNGEVEWIAGTGTAGSTDGAMASATFNQPTDVAVDANYNVYVTERGSHRIRKISAAGIVSTVAGTGSAGSADGNGINASFNSPSAVGVDKDGFVFVSDAGNHKIRMIDASYNVTTIAGTGVAGYASGSSSALNAKFNSPGGMYVNLNGDIYLADVMNHRIRVLTRHITKCPPCVGAGCNEYLWYVDKADVPIPATKILNLDGDANADGTPGDENYNVVSLGTPVTINAGNAIRTNFIDAYKRMNWVDPTADILLMEQYPVTPVGGGTLTATTMPVINDNKSLNSADMQLYYLLKVKKKKITCAAECTPTTYTFTCTTQCNDQRQALMAEFNDAEVKLNASVTTYLIWFGAAPKTLKQLVEQSYPLNDYTREKLNDADLELYEKYEDSRDAYENFDIQKCTALCGGTAPTVCEICQPDYRTCVFENMSQLSEGYSYFLDKWDAQGAFPYGDDYTTLMILSDPNNSSSLRVPDPNEQLALGDLLFNYIVSNVNGSGVFNASVKDRASWNTMGGTCTTCNPPSTGTPTCTVTNMDVVSKFPTKLLPVLETANARCVTQYTACQQMNGSAAQQKAYLCQQHKDNCIALLDPASPTYATDLATCNSQYSNCIAASPTPPTTIDMQREAMIREVLNRLYPLPAQASTINNAVTAITAATASMSLADLQKYLFDYEMQQQCLINCQNEFDYEYQLWLANLIKTTTQQIYDGYNNQCLGNMHEAFSVTYGQRLYHYTLYYYDRGNNLVSTVPPDGIDYIDVDNANAAERNRVPQHRMASTYTPTSLFTLTAASPDEGTTQYIYDKAGRIRFSQTAEQLARGTGLSKVIFSYTKYDNETRVVEAGEFSSIITTNSALGVQGFRNPSGTAANYASDKANDPSWPADGSLTFEETYIAYEGYGQSFNLPTPHTQTYLQGRVSKTWNSEGETHYSYDAHGRVNFVVQKINALALSPSPGGGAGGGALKSTDYVYTGLTSRVDQIIYQQGNVQEEFRQRYTYDNDYRLIKTEVSRNAGASWLPAADYAYYLHGPLKKTSLGNKIQDIDLTYNINGWLKAINNPVTSGGFPNESGEGTTNTSNFAKDVFAEAVNYYRGDYQKTGAGLDMNSSTVPSLTSNIVVNNKAKELFNGNVASTVTYNAFDLTNPLSGKHTQNTMTQAYRYDVLNRLTDMYTETSDAATFAYKTTNDPNDPFGVHMTYDANGNIESLVRRSLNATGSTPATDFGIPMDNLTYRYAQTTTDHYGITKKTTNKLAHVNDAAGDLANVQDIIDQGAGYLAGTPSTHNYKYDAKGRITSDVSSSITAIAWTAYDKVKSITKSDGTVITFTYNNKQQRLTKKVDPTGANNDITTIYSYDASGILMATYEQNSSNYKLLEQQVYGLSRIGTYKIEEVLTASPSSPSNDAGKQRFEISDHLGSVRAVVSGVKLANNVPDILSLADYSDFGWAMQNRTFMDAESYRYAYQGSERDRDVLNSDNSYYTTEFRMLDARLGRWFSPDPITHPWQSPYASMDNNPIALVDPLGLSSNGPPIGGDGSTTYQSDDGAGCWGGGGSPVNPPTVPTNFGLDFTSFAGAASPAKIPVANPSASRSTAQAKKVATTITLKPAQIAKATLNASVDDNDIWDNIVDGAKSMWNYFFGDEKPSPVPDKPVATGKQAISPVLAKKYFSGQSGKTNCKTTCDAILVKNGTKNPSGGTRHEVVGDGTQGKEKILMSAEEVMKIVDEYLENNKPMVVGVNYKEGTQYGTSSDHYIIIVGRGRDKNGFYYTFYDVGTSSDKGTSDENRLYLKDGRFQGSTKYDTKRVYTLSQLRTYGK